MTNIQEALKAAIKELETLKRVFEHDNSDDEIDLCKAALAEIEASEKCEPVGYVDRITLERWQLLKGTEYESAERGYIGFSKEPFKTKLTDCTLAVFTSPQPMRELQAHINTLREYLLTLGREASKLGVNVTICGKNFEEYLADAPAESLQAFENKVIEMCANEFNADSKEAKTIRALKEVK